MRRARRDPWRAPATDDVDVEGEVGDRSGAKELLQQRTRRRHGGEVADTKHAARTFSRPDVAEALKVVRGGGRSRTEYVTGQLRVEPPALGWRQIGGQGQERVRTGAVVMDVLREMSRTSSGTGRVH